MNDNTFDPAAASGEGNYKGMQSLALNEVLLNGDDRDGGYFRKRVLVGRTNRDEKPEEIALGKQGDSLTVVFLKIRRKLVERGKGGEIVRSTNEHNHKGEAVTLYDGKAGGQRITGIASDLRERFEGLRTVQIVYALVIHGPNEPELVRLTIKGASLGSEAKAESTTDFYKYLGSFGKDEHFYEYKTIMTPVLENGAQTYYAIDFKRGDKLNEKGYAIAMEELQRVHENCTQLDAARAAKIVKTATDDNMSEAVTENDSGINYPTDDINPDDIPF